MLVYKPITITIVIFPSTPSPSTPLLGKPPCFYGFVNGGLTLYLYYVLMKKLRIGIKIQDPGCTSLL